MEHHGTATLGTTAAGGILGTGIHGIGTLGTTGHTGAATGIIITGMIITTAGTARHTAPEPAGISITVHATPPGRTAHALPQSREDQGYPPFHGPYHQLHAALLQD